MIHIDSEAYKEDFQYVDGGDDWGPAAWCGMWVEQEGRLYLSESKYYSLKANYEV